MAWPACGACGKPIGLYDRAFEIRVVRQENDARNEVEVFRSYGCPCGWQALTVEKVYCTDPETLRLRAKFCQPADSTPSTGGG